MSRFEELDPNQYANWKITKESMVYADGQLDHGLRQGKNLTVTAARSYMSKAANALGGLDQNV